MTENVLLIWRYNLSFNVTEKVPALKVDRMVKQYTERWMMEYQQMKKLNNEPGEEVVQLINEDISDVKGTVQKIEQS